MARNLILGDSSHVLDTFLDNTFDSCVTDAPYEIGFGGNKWDKTGVSFSVQFWSKVLRVLKPGHYLAVFSYSTTYHRVACAIEDAGFEPVDMGLWLYGQGVPKNPGLLKPGGEPIFIGRKPGPFLPMNTSENKVGTTKPRHPSNLVLDETAGEMLDAQTGVLKSGSRAKGVYKAMGYAGAPDKELPAVVGDSGGASRFFYQSKVRGFKDHPTRKPPGLMAYWIRLLTPTRGHVLDPFMGSGSTGEAAVTEGREFTGIELDPDYYEVARRMLT